MSVLLTTAPVMNMLMPSEIIYSIDLALNSTEWGSLDAAIKTKPLLVVVETWTNWKNFNFTNMKYHYKFFTNGMLSSQVSIGPSEIISVGTTTGHNYHMDQIYFEFVDARGEVVRLNEKFGERIKGIVAAAKLVVEVNSAGNYQNYKLAKENERLRLRIDEIEKSFGKQSR